MQRQHIAGWGRQMVSVQPYCAEKPCASLTLWLIHCTELLIASAAHTESAREHETHSAKMRA